MAKSVDASLLFTLEVDIYSPKDDPKRKPYRALSFDDQHDAKNELLDYLRTKAFKEALKSWERKIEVDDNYHEVVEQPRSAEAWVRERFSFFQAALSKDLEYNIEMGEPCPTQLCTKVPSCGHDCLHCYELMRSDPEDPKGPLIPWEVESPTYGVRATVMLVLRWTTPGAGAHGADDHADAAAGGAAR